MNLTDSEMIVVLEAARIALSDADTADRIGERLDLSADFLITLHERLVATLNPTEGGAA